MSLPRAFLSHSSKDKPFVEHVAEALGREFCIFDKYCFHAGDDLIQSIEDAVATSALIVLFASDDSLKSDWVRLELNKARQRRLAEATYDGIALGLSDAITHRDLPAWLQKTHFERAENPELAARIIRAQIRKRLGEAESAPFVGRHVESARFEEEMASGGAASRVLVFYGLPAIGRRTLCARLAVDVLSFQRTVEIPMPLGEMIQDIAVTLASHVEPYRSEDDFKRRARDVRKMKAADAVKLSATSALSLMEKGALPVLIDEGGLIDESAILTRPVDALLRELKGSANSYIALVGPRRPEIMDEGLPRAVTTYVQPLSQDDTRRLLALQLRRVKVTAADTQLRALAEHCKGHPASTLYAAKLASFYGVDALAKDVKQLVDFRANFFLGYLRENVLSQDAIRLLGLLALYRALPMRVLGLSLGMSSERLAEQIITLTDLSLIHPLDGVYALAHPIEDAVLRVFGLQTFDHTTVANALSTFLEQAAPEERHISLTRALFRAARYSGTPPKQWALPTMAELVQLAKDLYYEREYDRAIALLREILAEDESFVHARDYLVRALIQSGRFEEAHSENELLRKAGRLKDFFYLSGFSLRKQGSTAKARDAYLEAEKRGRNDVPLYRELAMCCVLLDDDDGAQQWIQRANAISSANSFVLDLSVQISLKRHDIVSARATLERLKLVDRQEFYWYRRSTVEHAANDHRAAVSSAIKAVSMSERPSFAMISQVAKCQIESGNVVDAAKAIRRLESDFPRHGHDIKLGLWCKWEVSQGHFENADGYWTRLSDKSLAVHRALRLDIVRGLLQKTPAASPNRASLEAELHELQTAIGANQPRYANVDVYQ